MIKVGETLVSEDFLEREFVCNLTACKGACCVEGDAGAPLLEEELAVLDEEYEKFAGHLRPEGRAAIEKQGRYLRDRDGEFVAPLVSGKECAYTTLDDDGKAMCGIEQAWKEGATTFRKPVSCHLYPVRVVKYPSFEVVNYHKWPICSAACSLGQELGVSVFEFTREVLRRRFGDEWIAEMEIVAKEWTP
ncbi:MAG: DUF3109 family protein [Flavobacteriales bacterium]|nr:DUF3109 family protein [Flavobacteriales bacterium]